MILLFTDFGWQGPYVGELKLVLTQQVPQAPVIDLMHDAPICAPRAAGLMLAALSARIPNRAVVVAVVDPGVGSDERLPVILESQGRFFVGPGNSVFAELAARDATALWYEITWRPDSLSASFHGRDLFAPVAAMLHQGRKLVEVAKPISRPDAVGYAGPLNEVIYVDRFGNLWTGLDASTINIRHVLCVRDQRIGYAPTFAAQEPGLPFWYINSSGLVEIAVNRGSATEQLKMRIGDGVLVDRI